MNVGSPLAEWAQIGDPDCLGCGGESHSPVSPVPHPCLLGYMGLLSPKLFQCSLGTMWPTFHPHFPVEALKLYDTSALLSVLTNPNLSS